MDEKIKDKIKKLLALSESSTFDHESYVALQKAQALMAEYKLSIKDLTPEEIKKCVHLKTALSYGTASSDHYLATLSDIIAENFCCVRYSSKPQGSKTHYICFMGMEEDTVIADEALKTANNAIIRGYNKVYKDLCKRYDVGYMPAKYFNPAKIGYVQGYMAGLKEVLDAQKEQNQEWGLVLVAPKEATDFMDSLHKVTYNRPNRVNYNYYDDGYTDGKNFNMNKKISGNNNYMLND